MQKLHGDLVIWWYISYANSFAFLSLSLCVSTGLEHVVKEKYRSTFNDSELSFESHTKAKLGAVNHVVCLIRMIFT